MLQMSSFVGQNAPWGSIMEMRIFKNSWFAHFADKEGIMDSELKEAVTLLETNQNNADLGGGVYKLRLARPGEGKSGGYRVIVFYRTEERTFFAYAFAKSKRGNIDEKELRGYKKRAKNDLSLTDEQIKEQLRKRIFIEVL
jgi:hypothetical protein